jgi:glycosyltransferase involved in cell wall biosynthesis
MADFSKYYDIYISSSYSEGFGFSLAEAVRSKRPVVSADVSSVRCTFGEIVSEYYKINDIDSLLIAIQLVQELSAEDLNAKLQIMERNFSRKISLRHYKSHILDIS